MYKNYCDNCGIEIGNKYLTNSKILHFELRDELGSKQFGDICSWACVAVLAYNKSREQNA